VTALYKFKVDKEMYWDSSHAIGGRQRGRKNEMSFQMVTEQVSFGTGDCFVLIVLPKVDEEDEDNSKFYVWNPLQWWYMLGGCKNGPEACVDAVRMTAEMCGKTSFALYQIAPSDDGTDRVIG